VIGRIASENALLIRAPIAKVSLASQLQGRRLHNLGIRLMWLESKSSRRHQSQEFPEATNPSFDNRLSLHAPPRSPWQPAVECDGSP